MSRRLGWLPTLAIVACRPFAAEPGPATEAGAVLESDVVIAERPVLWRTELRRGHSNPYIGAGATTLLAAGSGGSVHLAGDFLGDVDFGGGSLSAIGRADAFVTKLDPRGGHGWTRRYGVAERASTIRAIAVDENDEVFVSGDIVPTAGGGSAFFLRLDANGAERWVRSTEVGARALRVQGADLQVFGVAGSAFDLGGGTLPADAFMAQLEGATGGHRSSVPLVPAPRLLVDVGRATVEADGSVTLSAAVEGGLELSRFGPDGRLSSRTLLRGHIADVGGLVTAASDGAQFILGNDAAHRYLVTKVSRAHEVEWTREIGGTGVAADEAVASSIDPDDDGGVHVAGHYRGALRVDGHPLPYADVGTRRFFVVKLGADGRLRWATTIHSEEERVGVIALAHDREGHVFFAGWENGRFVVVALGR